MTLFKWLFVTSHYADMKMVTLFESLENLSFFVTHHSIETRDCDCCLLRLFRKAPFSSHLFRAGSCMTIDPERETVRSFLGDFS